VAGRFVQADTIVPEPANPMAFDRYAYVYNNPLKYTDPTGHEPACGPVCSGISRYGPTILDTASRGAQWLHAQGQALVVQYGPTVVQTVQAWGDKIPAVYARVSGNGSANTNQGGNSGNVAGPGGQGPNDPWRWGTDYRRNYERAYKVTRDNNFQVHHLLPQKHRQVLAQANINVDDPRWLREVRLQDPTTGQNILARLYSQVWAEWERQLGRTPTAREIVTFAKRLEEQYLLEGTLFYRTGQNMPGRIDWSTVDNLLRGR
jgi:hypothetical protein